MDLFLSVKVIQHIAQKNYFISFQREKMEKHGVANMVVKRYNLNINRVPQKLQIQNIRTPLKKSNVCAIIKASKSRTNVLGRKEGMVHMDRAQRIKKIIQLLDVLSDNAIELIYELAKRLQD